MAAARVVGSVEIGNCKCGGESLESVVAPVWLAAQSRGEEKILFFWRSRNLVER